MFCVPCKKRMVCETTGVTLVFNAVKTDTGVEGHLLSADTFLCTECGTVIAHEASEGYHGTTMVTESVVIMSGEGCES